VRRVRIEPRPDWRAIVSAQGLVYCETLHPDGEIRPYWEDGALYAFSPEEIAELERASVELFDMCIDAGDRIVERGLWREMAIPEHAVERIVETWHSEPPSLIGRFDLRYDGSSPPKLLEFNADTPTSLVESAVVQWTWLEDRFPEADQWNEIHDRLLHAWRRQLPAGSLVHFAHTTAERSGEDLMNTIYLQDTAGQAGHETRTLAVEGIGWHPLLGFVDGDDRHIERIFKLYPWEWMVEEEFARHCLDWMGSGPTSTLWMEPIYKMLWSNKGLLPVLWELFPGHPNLLPAYFDSSREMTTYVRKPLLSREGENIQVFAPGEGVILETGGDYGAEGFIFQEFAPVPAFDGPNHPVLGVWMVDGEPAGLGVRESDGLITDNLSRFVPHLIEHDGSAGG
jgi:glutathionylspermidine synthase